VAGHHHLKNNGSEKNKKKEEEYFSLTFIRPTSVLALITITEVQSEVERCVSLLCNRGIATGGIWVYIPPKIRPSRLYGVKMT